MEKVTTEQVMRIVDETAMIQLGAQLARASQASTQGVLIYLHGELGTGKTTLVRGFIQAMGHQGKVKSPTYTLVEPYELTPPVYHFDLYRLADPEELDYLGMADYLHRPVIWLVEWPEQGGDYLPDPDLDIHLVYVDGQRDLRLSAHNDCGLAILTAYHHAEST